MKKHPTSHFLVFLKFKIVFVCFQHHNIMPHLLFHSFQFKLTLKAFLSFKKFFMSLSSAMPSKSSQKKKSKSFTKLFMLSKLSKFNLFSNVYKIFKHLSKSFIPSTRRVFPTCHAFTPTFKNHPRWKNHKKLPTKSTKKSFLQEVKDFLFFLIVSM